MTILSGANAKIAIKKEVTYGVAPGGNYDLIPIVSFELAETQQFSDNDLIGQGADTLRPQREISTFQGNVTTAIDLRAIGHWFNLAFGTAVDTGVVSTGTITFSGQPAVASTITINGVVFTFVSGAPSGAQIQIAATLTLTLDNMVSVLNASVNAAVDDCTYSKVGTTILLATNDTAGAAGNTFTLAASAASLGVASAPTLTGGGFSHLWVSGAAVLASYSAERQHPDATVPLYALYSGIRCDSVSLQLEPTGKATIQFAVNYKSCVRSTVTAAGTPVAINVERFSNYHNYIEQNGTPLAKIESVSLPYALNNEEIRYVGGRGEIGDIIAGIRTANGQMTARFEDWNLFATAAAETTFNVGLGFRKTPAQGGWKLEILVEQAEFGNPSDPINGPAGIKATFPFIGSRSTGTGRMMSVLLVNDVASY
jgi:hypothetical protein